MIISFLLAVYECSISEGKAILLFPYHYPVSKMYGIDNKLLLFEQFHFSYFRRFLSRATVFRFSVTSLPPFFVKNAILQEYAEGVVVLTVTFL